MPDSFATRVIAARNTRDDTLDLMDCSFGLGGQTEDLSDLEFIRSVEVGGKSLETFPRQILMLSHLESLAICGSMLRELPDLSDLKNLTQLIIIRNKEMSQLSSGFRGLDKVVLLSCTNNSFSTASPLLFACHSARRAVFDGNNISEFGLYDESFNSIMELSLAENLLDSIPKTVLMMSGLRHLNLRDNQIERLPNDIGELRNLLWLSLAGNRLCELGDCIVECEKLMGLEIQGNLFSELPPNLYKLPQLRELKLSSDSGITAAEVKKFEVNYQTSDGSPIEFVEFV
ncbi:MAG: leucine-rich repeat domain-containing protein [Pirellulaceae bacterium]